MSAAAKRAPSSAGKGKGKKAPPFNPVDGLKEMEDIHEVLAKAQQLRNYFQVERDKVNEMWEVTKKEVDNEQHKLLNAESALEDMERAHQVEMKVYKQKVRHLLYDQKLSVKQLKDDSDSKLQEAELAHERCLAEIQADKQRCLKGVQSTKEEHEEHVAEQRDSHSYMITTTKRQNHERELARLKASYEAKLTHLREDLELRRRAEINDAEEQRNEHINNLILQHESKFSEMKQYYNSITKNNLEIIQSLKDEIATMKKNDEHNESLMYDIEKENHNLVAPLEQAEKDVAELQQRKRQYIQDKQSLSMTRARLRTLRDDLKRLREDHADLQEQYHTVYDERDELKGKFEIALRDAMDIVNERNASLQQNLLEANAKVEERVMQFEGVLMAMNLEPATMEMVSQQIDRELSIKNQIIKDLHFELRKMEAKVSAVVTEYERRCRTVGLPPLPQESLAQP